MAVPEQTLQSLVEAAERRERQSRRNAFLYASVPLLLAVALVIFTALQIQRLASVQTELSATENKLELTNTQLAQSEQQISQSEEVLDGLKADLEFTQRDYEQAVQELEVTSKELAASRQDLEQANLALMETRQEAEALQQRVDSLEQELEDLTQQFHQSSTFKRFEVAIDPTAGKDALVDHVWESNSICFMNCWNCNTWRALQPDRVVL